MKIFLKTKQSKRNDDKDKWAGNRKEEKSKALLEKKNYKTKVNEGKRKYTKHTIKSN